MLDKLSEQSLEFQEKSKFKRREKSFGSIFQMESKIKLSYMSYEVSSEGSSNQGKSRARSQEKCGSQDQVESKSFSYIYITINN